MKKWQIYVVVILFNFVSFYRSLDGEFVFDDSVAILKNNDVNKRNISIQNIFSHDFWGNSIQNKDSHKSYRPLTVLSFAIQHEIEGVLSSRSMKTVNFAIHLICCCLLTNFLSALEFDTTSIKFASLMFATHPIHTEAVSGIVSRSDLIACFTFLICGIIYFNIFNSINIKLTKKVQFLTLITVGCISAIGILFKESAIMILPTIAVIDIVKNFRNFRTCPKNLIVRLFILLLFTVSILIGRLKVQNFESPIFRREDNPIAFADETITRILSQNYLYVLNTFLLLCPDWLAFDWSFDSIQLITSINDYRVMFVIIFYLILISLFIKGFWKRDILIALTLLIIPFLPASGIIRVGFVIAERILYIPSIGFCLLISLGLKKVITKFSTYQNVFHFMFLILVLFNTMKSYERSMDWTTEHRLFHSALNIVPNNGKLYYNIARIASDRKDINKAMTFYKKAIKLHPNYESAHMNLGNLYRETNDYHKAEFHLQRSVEILEEFPTAWMNLGIVQAMLKDFRASEKSYFKAISYKKNYANCYYNLGNLYIEMKNFSSAVESWKRAVSINPNHKKAWSNILAFYDNQRNKHEDVLKYSEIALNFLPNDTNILFSKANTLGKMSRYEEAEAIFKRIIDAEPTKSIFYANIGVLYHRWGKNELAKKNYKIALSLDSTLQNARNNLMKLQGVT